MKKVICNIQSLRGFAALSVLFFHILLMEKKWGAGPVLLPELLKLGASGVDLFFVISGFVMVVVTRGMFQEKGAVIRFLFRRVTRIYPLYWFYSVILLGVYLIRPELINPTMGGRVNLLKSFLLLPQEILPLLMVGWPLVHEMYFYLVFACFLLFPEKHLAKYLLLWGAFCLAGNLPAGYYPFLSANPYFVVILHPMTIEFIAGCSLAILIRRTGGKYGIVCLLTGIILLIVVATYHTLYPATELFRPDLRAMFFGLPYSVLLYGAVAIEMNSGKTISGILQKAGDQSYSLYLSHTIVINGVGWIWAFVQAGSDRFHLVFLAIMVVASLFASLFSFHMLEQPFATGARAIYRNLFSNTPLHKTAYTNGEKSIS